MPPAQSYLRLPSLPESLQRDILKGRIRPSERELYPEKLLYLGNLQWKEAASLPQGDRPRLTTGVAE